MKIGRNDLCPCGSNKKYKKCCLPSVSVSSPVSASISEPALDPLLICQEIGSVAIHEAGHAVANELLLSGNEYTEVTVRLLNNGLVHSGFTMQADSCKPSKTLNRDNLQAHLISTLCGYAAEHRSRPAANVEESVAGDIRDVRAYLQHCEIPREQWNELLANAYYGANDFLEAHWKFVRRVAEEIVAGFGSLVVSEEKTSRVGGSRVAEICQGERLGRMSTKLKRKSHLEVTAYHEAGHAVMAWCLHIRFAKATIVPGEDSLGSYLGMIQHNRMDRRTAQGIEFEDKFSSARLQAEKRAMVSMAGHLAQKRFAPRSRFGAHSDMRHVLDMLMRYAPFRDGAVDTRPHYNLLKEWSQDLLDAHWKHVSEVAKALLEKRTLSGSEVQAVIRKVFDDELRELQQSQQATAPVKV